MLNILYFNEGYVQMKLDRPQVYVSPDKRDIYISIRVEEASNSKSVRSTSPATCCSRATSCSSRPTSKSRRSSSTRSCRTTSKRCRRSTETLATRTPTPIPRTKIHEAERVVDITFEIDKGQKVYLGKINMVGNTKTRDKVIRRELRSWRASSTTKRASVNRTTT